MSAPDENKLNELRAAALEKELKKKAKDEVNDELMASVENEGVELNVHRMMQEAAHENEPGSVTGSVSRRGGNVLWKVLVMLVVAIAAGIAVFIAKAGSDGSSQESTICRTRCCDGTCSPSEGSGTCSYHGGIYHEGCLEEMSGDAGKKKK